MKKYISFIIVIMCFCLFLSGCQMGEKTKDETETILNNQSTQIKDNLSGRILTASDGSVLEMNNDGSYIWYKDAYVKDDNYYKGTYQVYVGAEAIAVLNGMSEYGFTSQEQYDYIARNSDKGVELDDWYVMVQQRTYRMVGGKSTDENTKIVYAGVFYEEQKVYDAVNCNSANYARFTVK